METLPLEQCRAKRPEYSAEEMEIFRSQQLRLHSWQTTENPPRYVLVMGRSAVDPDVFVVRVSGMSQSKWLMACGNTSFDGNIVGTDLWVRRAD